MTASLMDELTDVDDYESMFRAHYGRLVRAMTVVSGNSESAADAVQSAFVKAHVRWRRLRHYEDPVAWIRRVAINELRDEGRRNVRKQRAVQILGSQLQETTHEPVIDEMAELLAELPRQQRLAVSLYYVEQLTVAEIAVALKLSEGAVKFHLHRGRERLRAVLTGKGNPE
jgi:RNA polymerase sigma-70 factor, ECF subfamily